MNSPALNCDSILQDIHVLDGGMASELEYLGAHIDGPLWSAHVLEDAPEKILAVHSAYIVAGAQCIETASYQVSRMGYIEYGLTAQRADVALLHSVSLARTAISAFPGRQILIAVSLGPYGAALHNDAEYHGNYGCTNEQLVAFHRERIEIVVGLKGQEVLAFETLPSLAEAHAIGDALSAWPDLPRLVQLHMPRRAACGARRTSPRLRIVCRDTASDDRHWHQLHAAHVDRAPH